MSNAGQQPVWPAAYISAMEHNDTVAEWRAKWELAESVLTEIRRASDLPVNTDLIKFIRELKQERDALQSLPTILPEAEVDALAIKYAGKSFAGDRHIFNVDVDLFKQAITEALSLVRKSEDTEMLDWADNDGRIWNITFLDRNRKTVSNTSLRHAIREAMKK